MKNGLRILQLVNVRWWNACADYAVSLALGLHRRGHRVITAGQKDSPPLIRAAQLGLPVCALQPGGYRPWRLVAGLSDLVTLIRREDVEVLNAHRAEGHLLASLAAQRMARRVPVVRTRGDVRPPKGHALNRWLHTSLTDAVVVPAGMLKEPVCESLGRSPRRLDVIPPGVDPERFRSRFSPEQGRKALGWSEPGPLVGIVGRLSPVKGHRTFIEAARLVLQTVPEARFAAIGGEAQLGVADLQDLAAGLGIGHRVWFTGRVDEPARYIEALDVAVVASIGSEVICRVALEYMAMSRPVVGTRINAIPEVVAHGSTGLLVPPGDARAMSEAILALLKDSQKARAMGLAGRRRVEQLFTLDRLAQRTEALYGELLVNRR